MTDLINLTGAVGAGLTILSLTLMGMVVGAYFGVWLAQRRERHDDR